MDFMHNGYIANGISWFDGHIGKRYEMGSIKMETFLQAHGYDIWKSVVTRYTATNKLKTATKKKLKRNNKIVMDFILEELPDSIKEKVGKCSLAKDLWEKLQNIYSKKSHPITGPKNIDHNEE
jgi:hypothetical protein